MPQLFHTIVDLVTVAALLFGLFFMFVGALGLVRLPDFFNRMHAASKPVTLGISSMLVAVALYLTAMPDINATQVVTKIALTLAFLFVAAPVGAHLLGKAAHMDDCPMFKGTVGDEYRQDTKPR
jgi:monovalent cation/proton antiporter MnhG/PhaG subunit